MIARMEWELSWNTQAAQGKRHQDEPGRRGEQDDGGHDGRAAENRGEETGESEDKVVGGDHRDAKNA